MCALPDDVANTIAPVEAAVQPVQATVNDTVGTLTDDVANTTAPVEATVQPVLATVDDTAGIVTNDVAGTIAPVEATVQPMLAPVGDTADTLTHDVAGTIAPVETTLQPVPATASDTVSALTNDVTGATAPIETAAPSLPAAGTDAALPAIGDPLSLDAPGVADTSNVAAFDVGSADLVSGAAAPAHPDLVDVPQAAAPDMSGGDHAVANAVPVVDTANSVLASTADAAGQSTTLSQTAASDSADAHTPGSSAPALEVAEPTLATASSATDDVAQPGHVASDGPANAAPVVDTTEPVLASEGTSLSNNATDVLQPPAPDTGAGQADALLALATAPEAPIEVAGSATAAPANAATDSSNAPAVDQTVITADVIALDDAAPPPANALYTGNQYTDYGVTLSSDIVVPPQNVVSGADTASAQDTSAPAVVDVGQPAPPPPEMVDTIHPIEHVGPHDAIL
jgi:hypothetical protein